MGNEATEPFAVEIPLVVPILIDPEPVPEETLLAAVNTVPDGGFVDAFDIDGNPVAVEDDVLVDRTLVIVAGGGTREAVELFAGSS